ncbi:MAG: glycosyltransferase family 39 protein [Anaerolineales bacterium]|nr:glycosyltransferase family 39 protein [Anaerolineales bacterium]
MPVRARPAFAWPALAVLMLAAGLRGFQIGAQPLRGDEAFSVTFAQLPWPEMLRVWVAGEPHPPLHFIFLRYWLPLAGESDLAVRWPGVLAAVVTVALMHRLGRQWFGERAGILAALLGAFSPFLIWYAQDGRMYPFMTAFTLAALWETWRAAHHDGLGRWALAGGWWLLNLFNHYFSSFALAATLLALAIASGTRRTWRRAGLMALAVSMLYLPWAIFVSGGLAGQVKNWPLNDLAWRVLAAYSVGVAEHGAQGWTAWLGAGAFVVLMLAGARWGWRGSRDATIWLMTVAAGVPVLCIAVTAPRSAFAERFILSAAPFALMLAAIGFSVLPPRWSLLLTGALATGALVSQMHAQFDPAFRKSPNWRALMAHLQGSPRAGEVMLVNYPDPAFYHYYRAGLPVETAPPAPWPQSGEAATVAQLERLRDSYAHIRFLFQPDPGYDPQGFVGAWLEDCCEKTDDRFVDVFRVQSFDTPAGSLAARQPLRVEFERGLQLTGYRFVNPEPRAGDSLRLTLFWEAREPLAEAYTVFVHFVAPDGFYIAGADGVPRNGKRPTFTWAAGETVIDPRLIPLPTDLPPGEYFVEVGWYIPDSGQRLRTSDGADKVRLPQAVVVN